MDRACASRAPMRLCAALVLLAACTRDPIDGAEDDGPTVDATIYAQGFCSLRCWRLEECGLDQGTARQDCEDACVDETIADLPDDPCWAEGIELRRCLVRWSACEDVPDEDAPDDGGAMCEPKVADLDACEP